MKEKHSDIELHSAGATIRHQGPFNELPSYENDEGISQEFRSNWVIPYYFNLSNNDDDWVNKMIGLKSEITEEIILKNLGDFNWRTRSTGAFFAAITENRYLTEIIGNHLLKSEVCYAGEQYAVTLASFNTKEAIDYLNKYLGYYLLQLDLDFDQIPVVRAIKYLDEINGTNNFNKHSENLKNYQKHRVELNKATIETFAQTNVKGIEKSFEGYRNIWTEEIDIIPFKQRIETINKIKNGS